MMQLVYPNLNGDREIYMDCLNALRGEQRESMIDLGCNLAPHTPLLGFKERTYVDILHRELDHKEEQQYFKQADILDTPMNVKYSTALNLDCIEHLTVKNGIRLINIMKGISDRQIFFSPLTDLFGMDYETDNPEAHRSLWSPEMIEDYFPNEFMFISFPNYHMVWNGGAFFFASCRGNIKQDFERVSNILKTKSWAKH